MTVIYTDEAKACLVRLDRPVARRIHQKLQWFARHFSEVQSETLTGSLKGFLKLRVGDWRVLYTIDHSSQQIVVHFIDHRRSVYDF
ncbi:type II toxin-antitoxin system RelE/ParE family toxin [Candidatus Berkelbacteria bacterium]|nr:type II toxin-antitoxin system RelE/ParE family toxin [Candidatus Berkelbacteria bacterium]